ncbi:MAG: hypothetical protein ACM3NT_11770 [Methylocystaceae bacterium]
MIAGQIWWAVLAFFVSGVLELAALYFLLPLLQRGGAERNNYRGQLIPVAAGISLPLVLLICYFPYRYFQIDSSAILIGIILMAFLGLIDDLLGNRDTMGFRGHIKSLLHGTLTTGGLKMLMGGVVALYTAAFFSAAWYWWLLNGLIIALSTNLLNLLDLRPGRAIKGFFIFLLPVMILAPNIERWLLLPVLGAVTAYFPFDLRARAMMGDSGSNILGFVLGYLAASVPGFGFKIGTLIFLIGINLLAEKVSLSAIIEKVGWLRYIDHLGREMKMDDQQRTAG